MLDEKDIEYLEKLFVPRKECNDINAETQKELAQMDARQAKVEARLDVISKLLWVIATASIGTLATMILNLVKG